MTVLRRAVRATLNDVDFKATMNKLSESITYLDGPEFEKLWNSEAERLGRVVERIGRIQ
jgi:tripartite-type tricarboxylate transporter receptor subunit TctC